MLFLPTVKSRNPEVKIISDLSEEDAFMTQHSGPDPELVYWLFDSLPALPGKIVTPLNRTFAIFRPEQSHRTVTCRF